MLNNKLLGLPMKYSVLLLLFTTFSLSAAEYKPYPVAKISVQEWENYRSIVINEYIGTEQNISDQNLVIYTDDKNQITFAFTSKGHPAHPAWITRKVVKIDDSIGLEQIGYFAGKEKPFAVLFSQYLELNKKIEESMRGKTK